jgi:hypothetical protein
VQKENMLRRIRDGKKERDMQHSYKKVRAVKIIAL